MGKILKLSESELRSVINEAISNVLSSSGNEDGGNGSVLSELDEVLSQVSDLYVSLKGFVSEYKSVSDNLIKKASELGLELYDIDSDSIDLGELLSGGQYNVCFEFTLNMSDISGQPEEAKERMLNYVYNQLSDAIGSLSFGQLRMYTTEDGISVYYSFSV